jgi:endoglucanase
MLFNMPVRKPILSSKLLTSFVRLLLVISVFFGGAVIAAEVAEKTAVQTHGALSVKGNRIVDASGSNTSLAGPSLFWGNKGWVGPTGFGPDQYYNADVVAYFQSDWNASIIRIAMGSESRGGYLEEPLSRMEKIEAVADAAIEQGMYFIVDWHSHHAEDKPDEAVEFFQKIARKYGHTENLIYEIYNEPLNDTDWASTVKPYSEKVIAAIRKIDADNIIVVGTQTWSQDVDKAADDPILGFDNLAYTLHFYAGTHKQDLRDKASYALEKGLALMVTEWGTVNANGDGGPDEAETKKWMAFLKENDLSHCNWSAHSKKEGASMLKPLTKPDGDWTDTDLTRSGKIVKDIVSSWHNVDYAGAK